MLAMTAAHRSLPLPTYVEVTNLKNGKKVIVKVNDRGPFEKGRIIDLSYAAAKKLGMANHGVAHVEVRAIDPRNSSVVLANNTKKPAVGKLMPGKPVYLQVGAFQNKSYADRLQKQLKGMISSPVQVRELAKAKKYYRVQIGPIRDAEMVAQINKQLKSIGLDGKEMVG
jgi:rare lipoprotein A